MCGWLSLPASEASARNALCFMRSFCGSAFSSNRNTLIATSRSANGSLARYTRLVAPAPISRITGYLPMCSCSSNFNCRSVAEQRSDVLQQLGLLVGLAKEGVDAELRRLVAVLVGGARGDHDDRNVGGARVAAHVLGEVEAVHARHLDVDQHHPRQRVLD